MKCNYRYCNKEINFGRPDRKFCNKNCKKCEKNIQKEIKSLNRKNIKSREFIEKSKKIHGNKFKYDLIVYNNCREKVKIICPKHGIFEQTPNNHLYNKQGCNQCSVDSHKIYLLDLNRIEKLKKIHNNKYNYIDININNGFINIICPHHGLFIQYLYSHEYGHGCPKCNSSSIIKKLIKKYLDTKDIKYKMNHTFKQCRNKKVLRFDFFLIELNTVIEYNGEHHFLKNKNIEYFKKNDEIKNNFCFDNNIELIRIPYYESSEVEGILTLNLSKRN